MLQVYLKSMQTRYFIELMLFIIMAIFFQYEIGQYATSSDASFSDFDNLIEL
jgi:hypothetical protein